MGCERRHQPDQFVWHRFETGPTLRQAFTLVELVIVVTIIGIIGAIAAPRLAIASSRTTESAIRSDGRE